MPELAVTAMGSDRPGIVAAVAAVLHERGGNIEDSAMTILRGRFSMVLLVDSPDDAPTLEQALRAATDPLGLHLTVADAGASNDSASATHLLSVYGSDQPGILSSMAAALAACSANVTDMSTRVIGDDEPVYAMVVELWTDDESEVRAAVGDAATRLGVDWTLRSFDDTTY